MTFVDLLCMVVMQRSNNSDHSISSSIRILFETAKREECASLLLLSGPMHVGVLIVLYMYSNQVLLEGVREITFFTDRRAFMYLVFISFACIILTMA